MKKVFLFNLIAENYESGTLYFEHGGKKMRDMKYFMYLDFNRFSYYIYHVLSTF